MDPLITELNRMFVTTYRSICKVEEAMLRALSDAKLSLSEMHTLECIGTGPEDGRTVTDIAQELEIAPPSATVMVKRLEKKGYVTKRHSAHDGRRVHVELTREGRRAETAHRYFHRQMARAVVKNMSEAERVTLMEGLNKLNDFLDQKVRQAQAQYGEEKNT